MAYFDIVLPCITNTIIEPVEDHGVAVLLSSSLLQGGGCHVQGS